MVQVLVIGVNVFFSRPDSDTTAVDDKLLSGTVKTCV